MVAALTQREVDKVRVRVLLACTITAVEDGVKKPKVRHLWFPKPGRTSPRQLRDGNAPSDRDRPPHLRGLHLVIDVGEIPEDVRDAVLAQRQQARSATSEPTRMLDVVTDPRLVELIERNTRAGGMPWRG